VAWGLKKQAVRAGSAVKKLAGKVPTLNNIVLTELVVLDAVPINDALKPFSHLLILQPLTSNMQVYYFKLGTTAFDELRRQT